MGARLPIELFVEQANGTLDTESPMLNGYVVRGKMNDTTKKKIEMLLKASPVDQNQLKNNLDGNNIFAVGARAGTTSPDSSNIGDILRDIGLGGEDIRIEPITIYNDRMENARNSRAKNRRRKRGFDRMTQGVYPLADKRRGLQKIFATSKPIPVEWIDVSGDDAMSNLQGWCKRIGISLNYGMIERLIRIGNSNYKGLLSDVLCFNFVQANSEHCRHQIFNAKWIIDGLAQGHTLMDMIRATYEANPDRVISAYTDNATVFRREFDDVMDVLEVDSESRQYVFREFEMYLTAKVETHNHPTAISPDPGAATGVGGEIRDEGAVGKGAKTGQGTAVFVVSDTLFGDPNDLGQNPGLATPLEIMTQGPLGATHFANAYGRPTTTGTFIAYSGKTEDGGNLGFAKPTMAAGGLGMVKKINARKPEAPLPVDTQLIQIGGPNFRIGIGGASGSSGGLSSGSIEYSSVQRANPEMQRRCQKAIDRLDSLSKNPILAIHDVGAGGIGNAFVELGDMGKKGAVFDLQKALIADPSLSLREIWSNESQERYVLAISPEDMATVAQICQEEGVPLAEMGIITEGNNYVVKNGDEELINVPFEQFFYKENPVIDVNTRTDRGLKSLELSKNVRDSIEAVLGHATVASNQFLVTIGDQTVGGLTTQNQMAGPWRVPVTDVGVMRDGYHESTGHAMAGGEALSIAPISPEASVRMAITEALTNLLASDISDIKNVIFSGNWMANLKDKAEFVNLFTAVKAASEFCIELGIPIPTGKDSLSMQAKWEHILENQKKSITVGAPVVGLFTAFSPVLDAVANFTPYLVPREDTELLLIDLGHGKQRLGGSILAQVHGQIGDESPDIDADSVKNLYRSIIELKRSGKILAYHDKSAGGLMATLSEMAFASHAGLDIDISKIASGNDDTSIAKALFNQEAGVVVQILKKDKNAIMEILRNYSLGDSTHRVAQPKFPKDRTATKIRVHHGDTTVYEEDTIRLHKAWSTVSDRIRMKRENTNTVASERNTTHDYTRNPVEYVKTYDVKNHEAHDIIRRYDENPKLQKPKVAILRAPGTNGENEMANKFMMAGFDAYDVKMEDLISGRVNIEDFQGFAACGGFSYRDVLGAGTGWAQTILQSDKLREDFMRFFQRKDTFSLGVCNGCQMMSQIKDLIPGAEHFPNFKKNTSNIFESRDVDVTIPESNAIIFQGMAGSKLPITISHGEGRAEGEDSTNGTMKFIDHTGASTLEYPYNPNGSEGGNTAYTNIDGRHNVMMPHPERENISDYWDQIFYNLRVFSENNKA